MNSLSAVEEGKFDEVVTKVSSAREGGLSGGVGAQATKLEGGKKTSASLEEELVRSRTRFSIFEAWYQALKDAKAIGTFEGWGPEALKGIEAGDTVELHAVLQVAPIQTLFRLYLWFADQAKASGTLFSQKGEELKNTKEAERTMRALLGDDSDDRVTVFATPKGQPGPTVAMGLSPSWLIGKLGRMGGEYTVLAQVDQVVARSEEYPTLRLTQNVAPTPLELKTLKDSIRGFIEPAKTMGILLTESEASISGPALWLDPIAIYK